MAEPPEVPDPQAGSDRGGVATERSRDVAVLEQVAASVTPSVASKLHAVFVGHGAVEARPADLADACNDVASMLHDAMLRGQVGE